MWFTNGWLRLGSKKRAPQPDNAEGTDKENADRPYPTMKKGTRASLFGLIFRDFLPCLRLCRRRRR